VVQTTQDQTRHHLRVLWKVGAAMLAAVAATVDAAVGYLVPRPYAVGLCCNSAPTPDDAGIAGVHEIGMLAYKGPPAFGGDAWVPTGGWSLGMYFRTLRG
jgi:hypothetical protein